MSQVGWIVASSGRLMLQNISVYYLLAMERKTCARIEWKVESSPVVDLSLSTRSTCLYPRVIYIINSTFKNCFGKFQLSFTVHSLDLPLGAVFLFFHVFCSLSNRDRFIFTAKLSFLPADIMLYLVILLLRRFCPLKSKTHDRPSTLLQQKIPALTRKQ